MTIKEARTKAGLTQAQMSEHFGIPIRTISNWESGSRKCVDYVERLIVEKLTIIATEKSTTGGTHHVEQP